MGSYPALDLRFAEPDDAVLEDLLYAQLDAFEPLAVEHDDPSARWRVFFSGADMRDAARAALAAIFGSQLASLVATDVDDEDWARRSQAALTSVRIGRIVVSPPWDTPQRGVHHQAEDVTQSGRVRPQGDVNIVIEPSMGFGTGHHATTRLCLELLQELEIVGLTVLDVGTGSGVLAIAARMLGADAVTAVDNDPDALGNARDNIARNGVADAVQTRCTDLAGCTTAADIVLANLTGAVLQRHARELTHLVRPGGRLVVSGFGPEERDYVVAALGGQVERDAVQGEWAAVMIAPGVTV